MRLRKIRRKDGSFVWHTYHDYKGQRSRQTSTGTGDRAKAEQIGWDRAIAFQKGVDSPLQVVAGKPLTLDMMLEWKLIDGQRRNLHEQYRTQATRAYFRALALYPWDFTRICMEDKRRWMDMRRKQVQRNGKPPMWRTLKKELGMLHWGLREAQDRDYEGIWNLKMPDFPKEPVDDKRQGRHIPPALLNRWRAELPEPHASRVLVMLSTGLRHAEMRRVEGTWIRTATEAPEQGIVAYLDIPFRAAKAAKPRTIALTAPVLDALRRTLATHHPDYRHHFAKAAEAVGLTPVPHERDLRRNCGEVVGEMVSERDKDLLLGHAKVGAGTRYDSAHDRRMARVARVLAEAFPPVALESESDQAPIRELGVNLRLSQNPLTFEIMPYKASHRL